VSWLKGGFLSPANEGGARLRQGLFAGVPGLAFLFLYVIDTSFDNPRTDVPAALLPFLVVVAVAILLVTPDWIHASRSPNDRHIAFYRAQLVAGYIERRYGLSAGDARQRWLGVLRSWRDARHPNHPYYPSLLRAKYECRMVFYLQRVLAWLAALSLLALVVLAAMSWAGLDVSPFYSFDSPGLTAARVAFPLVLLGGALYLRAANVADTERPSGVWLRWKEINDELKAWWDRNEGAAPSG